LKPRRYPFSFRSGGDTLKQFAKDRFNEEIGFIAILHTWDQNLNRHLHIHCIVPGSVRQQEKVFVSGESVKPGVSGEIHGRPQDRIPPRSSVFRRGKGAGSESLVQELGGICQTAFSEA
jgi:hypothetical protein